jgi:hypothetical protein
MPRLDVYGAAVAAAQVAAALVYVYCILVLYVLEVAALDSDNSGEIMLSRRCTYIAIRMCSTVCK